MNKDVTGTFDTYFGKLDDPHIERHKFRAPDPINLLQG